MTYILYCIKTGKATLFSLDDFEKLKKTEEWSEVKPSKKPQVKKPQVKPVEGVEDGKDK